MRRPTAGLICGWYVLDLSAEAVVTENGWQRLLPREAVKQKDSLRTGGKRLDLREFVHEAQHGVNDPLPDVVRPVPVLNTLHLLADVDADVEALVEACLSVLFMLEK